MKLLVSALLTFDGDASGVCVCVSTRARVCMCVVLQNCTYMLLLKCDICLSTLSMVILCTLIVFGECFSGLYCCLNVFVILVCGNLCATGAVNRQYFV